MVCGYAEGSGAIDQDAEGGGRSMRMRKVVKWSTSMWKVVVRPIDHTELEVRSTGMRRVVARSMHTRRVVEVEVDKRLTRDTSLDRTTIAAIGQAHQDGSGTSGGKELGLCAKQSNSMIVLRGLTPRVLSF
jgi:hypothetical protein